MTVKQLEDLALSTNDLIDYVKSEMVHSTNQSVILTNLNILLQTVEEQMDNLWGNDPD